MFYSAFTLFKPEKLLVIFRVFRIVYLEGS